MAGPGGEYRVILTVKQPFHRDFTRWSFDRIGDDLGVVIKGKLVRVEKLDRELYGIIAIGFASREEAHTVAAEIRAGGFYDEVSSPVSYTHLTLPTN